MLTGKTIGQLTFLETPTTDTLIPVELNGDTYHMAYSSITINGGGTSITGGTYSDGTLNLDDSTGGTITITGFTSGGTSSYEEVTYSELVDKINNSLLNAGSFYLITDFKTCYDQPDFDYNASPITSGNYKDEDIEPIIVLAISPDKISDNAFQPTYPNDKIKYDWTFNQTEVTNGPAFGRITERIDEYNNRTDYDHRQIKFKRYRYYEVEFSNPYNGTVQVDATSGTEMIVSGTDTDFTNLSVGNRVGFDDTSYKVFEITNIDSNTSMTITGFTSVNAGPDIRMYSTNWSEYSSYYQNNVEDTSIFEEYYTFDLGNNPNFNNYIGNYSNLHNSDGTTFILANNVFHSEFKNNKFGDMCYNNTFFDDCWNNNVGNFFYNNITDDDFDGNVIGNYFNNNRITSNFQYNRIGETFEDNYLVQNSFYRNNIMNDFKNNQISNNDFQNNEIGSQFANNKIYAQFYKNDVGNGYNNNKHYAQCYGNLVGNGFNNNNVYCSFYENKIGDIFGGNDLGDENNFGSYEFYKNDIGSDFNNNDCLGTFAYNRIGSNFYNNVIGDGFGYGYNSSQGNTIGNYFYDNTIGEYFYNNNISDGFYNNTATNYFQLNKITSDVNSTDFTSSTHVYGNYNCEIFRNTNANFRLSYVDSDDILNITNITD